MSSKFLSLKQECLEVCYAEPDHPFALETIQHLQTAHSSLTAYFSLSPAFPHVRASLASDRATFDELIADVLNVYIERPSDPRRIAQPQRNDIVFLSPSAYARDSSYEYVPEDFKQMIHHELTHVVQEHLSPNIETSPFWWDEGLAVYLSAQWCHESQFGFREPVLAARREARIPLFREIRQDASLAYAFGWTIVRYLERERGKDAIASIVTQMGDGDVFAGLGEDEHSIETQWQAWLLGNPQAVECSPRKHLR